MEDRVRKLVYNANGRKDIEDKRKARRGTKKATNVATLDDDPEDEDCDLRNMDEW